MKIYTNKFGDMTRMAALPIYCKNLTEIFFSRTNGLMKLETSNYDPGLTLTYFTPKSNLVTQAFVWEKVKGIYF